MTTPTWPELIVLMCFGETEEPPFTGVVEVEDRYGYGAVGDEFDAETDVDLPQTVRVHKSGRRYRVETLDGEVLYIKGHDRAWQFRPGAEMPVMVDFADDEEMAYGSYGYAVERPDPTQWRGNDFSRPAGPMRRTTFLGRDAWEVELAPPPHKPAPVTLVIDAVTGMQLRWGVDQVGDDFRWTAIEHGVDLSDDLLTWDGPFVFAHGGDHSDLPDDVRDGLERSDAERAAAAAALRLPELELRLSARPEVWEVGDDGSFRAMVDVEAFLSLERRPHAESEWETDDPRPSVAWTQDRWDWRLHASSEISTSDVDRIRRQLAEPRPDHG